MVSNALPWGMLCKSSNKQWSGTGWRAEPAMWGYFHMWATLVLSAVPWVAEAVCVHCWHEELSNWTMASLGVTGLKVASHACRERSFSFCPSRKGNFFATGSCATLRAQEYFPRAVGLHLLVSYDFGAWWQWFSRKGHEGSAGITDAGVSPKLQRDNENDRKGWWSRFSISFFFFLEMKVIPLPACWRYCWENILWGLGEDAVKLCKIELKVT